MSTREWALLLLLSLFWGATFFFIEIGLRDLAPFTLVLGRVGLAACALLLFVRVSGYHLPRDPAVWRAFFIMALLNNVVPFSLIVGGQTQIDSGQAAVLNATTPFFGILLAHFVASDERITINRLVGIGLGIVGVAVLVGPDAVAGLGQRGLGQIAILGAGFSYACAAIYGRRFRQHPPVVVAAGQVTAAAIMLLPIALVIDRPWMFSPDALTWGALLGLALPGTAIAYVIYFRLLTTAGATNLMLVTLIIPVTAVLLGMLILGERPGPLTFGGMALILGGLVIIDGRVVRWLFLVGQRP